MRTKFTFLVGAMLVFMGAAMAQNSKTLDENYSRFDFLKTKVKGTNEAKAVDAVLTATGGYVSGATVDIPMNLILNNTDAEYGDSISITFPAGFTINSVSNDDVFGPSFDNPAPGQGDPEPYNGIDGQTVSWGDNDDNYGGITPTNDYPFSINVTVDMSVTGDQTIDFDVSGDGFGAAPADFSGSITLSESAVGLPLDFELPADQYTIEGFGGSQNTSIIPNPDMSGVNMSANVWQQTQDAANTGETFAGAVVDLATPVDFTGSGLVAMDIWTPIAADVTLRFEIVNNDPASAGMERTLSATTTGGWETLTFDFTDDVNIGNEFVRCVVFFNLGANNTDDTFYADNIRNTEPPTVFDIVANSAVHETLETALIASGLDGVTSDPEVDLTLFAPTDAAFAEIQAVVDELLMDPTGALANVLLYHVVAGTALSGDLSDGQEVLTLQGETVTVAVNGDVITINGAEVIIEDIIAVNGVVHVIDAVLVPSTCTVFAGGPYNDFTTAFGGAPVQDGNGDCPLNAIDAFQSWASEGYIAQACVEGVEYEFGLQDGASGAWDPSFVIIDFVTGEVIASETEGLSITWVCPADGDYIWIIQEEGLCGNQTDNTATDNGFPYMTCNGTSSTDDLVNVVDLSVYPNPSNNQFTVELELDATKEVTIDIVNVVGQVVKSIDLGTRSVGLNREYIDVNDLSEGIYLMNVTVGTTQGTVKVQVVR